MLFSIRYGFNGYDTHIQAIERVQHKFLKYFSYKIERSYPERGVDYELLLQRPECEPLASRRILINATFMRNIVIGRIDSQTLLAQINFRVPSLASRLTETFTTPTEAEDKYSI